MLVRRKLPFFVLFFFLAVFTFANYEDPSPTCKIFFFTSDRLWSLLPPMYIWHFNLHDFANNKTIGEHRIYGFHPRLLIISVLTTLWGARLTYNFWRKGMRL